MSYFGTSGPRSSFAHSIGAGYQRQLNLNNARKTSPFGRLGEVVVKSGNEPLKLSTFNTSKAVRNTVETRGRNILDRANDAYNSKVASRYGSVNDLFNKVDNWRAYEAEVMFARRRDLDAISARYATLSKNIESLEENHNNIMAELDLINKGRAEEADLAKVSTLTNANRMMFPGYTTSTYRTIRSQAYRDLDGQFDPTTKELVKAGLLQKKEEAKKKLRDATLVLDRIHMKGVEDWMVDGPLMRESKTALIVSPLMLGIGVAATAYAFTRVRKSKRSPTANKGAAFAVFS